MFHSHSQPRNHWAYTWIPVLGAFIWSATLLAMLITWLASGRPQYVTQQGKIAYISDIAASFLQPLFIVCCCITAICFFLSLVFERWLRHSGRLLPNMRKREKVFSSLAILGSFIGGCGLILLSVFNTAEHRTLHRTFLTVFILGVAMSAIFTIVEFMWLSQDFGEARKLRRSYIAKAIIAGILIVLAVAFGVTLYKSMDVGAVLEWVIALGFTIYLLTFYYDLRMSKGVGRGELSGERLLAMQQADVRGNGNGNGLVGGGPVFGVVPGTANSSEGNAV